MILVPSHSPSSFKSTFMDFTILHTIHRYTTLRPPPYYIQASLTVNITTMSAVNFSCKLFNTRFHQMYQQHIHCLSFTTKTTITSIHNVSKTLVPLTEQALTKSPHSSDNDKTILQPGKIVSSSTTRIYEKSLSTANPKTRSHICVNTYNVFPSKTQGQMGVTQQFGN